MMESTTTQTNSGNTASRVPAPRFKIAAEEGKQWWQRPIGRSTSSFVGADLNSTTEKSLFLQALATNAEDRTALFHRSEIITAKRKLGSGGFCNVYEVVGFNLKKRYSSRLTSKQRKLRKEYASQTVDEETGEYRFVIKHLKSELLRKKRHADFGLAASDLALEAAYMARLDHPHILKLRGLPIDGLSSFDEGTNDSYFLMLDRLSVTLDERLIEWSEERKHETVLEHAAHECEKMDMARQLADALAYLHENRLIFRDLKPQNVGFTLDGEAQLFDFGLCREMPEGDIHDVYEMSDCGTRRYMAPEVFTAGCYNTKVDVYSWAMVVWQLFSLQKPFATFSADDHYKLVCLHGERPTFSADDVPLVIRDILRKSWRANVAERLCIAEARDKLDLAIAEHFRLTAYVDPTMSTSCLAERISSHCLDYDSAEDIDETEALSITSPAANGEEHRLRRVPIDECGKAVLVKLHVDSDRVGSIK